MPSGSSAGGPGSAPDRPERGGFPGGPPPGGMGPGGPGGMSTGPAPGGPRMGGGISRQVLTATFTNYTDHAVTIKVTLIKSILGSFIPTPETSIIEPGASVTLEPMRGSMENLAGLQINVELDLDGRRELKLIELKPDTVNEPARPAPPAS